MCTDFVFQVKFIIFWLNRGLMVHLNLYAPDFPKIISKYLYSTLEPQRTCKHVTKLVPKLEPVEECVDVPKEVCTRSRTNPRKVKKPVVKKWCYVPSEESGLA